ncbi:MULTISPECIES: HK97-gp10 family putative phage morphogenesis protein [unclassified Acinetobacter]|uniref:HK97-gp10 family putative phage morphogenesis protein n=1 Tax=unclassified Acinetobacter TaxID=196816 RepID=UPI0015D2A712|nr:MULTISPECIES: HK97-gp10 family putative phage morphogenesis protein [unclassified Acinetobacter]
MAVELNIEGMDQFKRKIEQLSNPKKVKQIARKAGRQAMNLVRDAARTNAKAIDDPETSSRIWKNIVTQGGKSRNSNEVKLRVGVRGGSEFWRMNKGMFRKSDGRTVRMDSPYYTYIPNDTRSWWLVEFGTVKTRAQPFMRPALSQNIDEATTKFVQVFDAEITKALSEVK